MKSTYQLILLALFLLVTMPIFAQNVGIGTTNPTQKLDVNGQLRVRGGSPVAGHVLSAVDGTGTLQWADPNTLITDNDNQDLGSSASGTDCTITITSGTGTTINVADNDNDPTNEYNSGINLNATVLELTDGGGTLSQDLSALSFWERDVANGELFPKTLTDQVGIGTANPAQQLHITQTARVEGDVQVLGSMLGTSDTRLDIYNNTGAVDSRT